MAVACIVTSAVTRLPAGERRRLNLSAHGKINWWLQAGSTSNHYWGITAPLTRDASVVMPTAPRTEQHP